jgi:predicted methyltransferase
MDAILSASDRPIAQRERDAARKTEVALVLQHVKSGQRVLDLGSGGGYMAMILSSAVGANGQVDAQTPAAWIDNFKLAAPIAAVKAARSNVSILTEDFGHLPVPAKAKDKYDLVFAGMIYHDTFNEPQAIEAKMNSDLFQALKSGGYFIVTDHHAQTGSGTRDTQTLHRIEKSAVINSVTKAGFKLVLDSPALETQTDDVTLNVYNPQVRGKTSRFALVFQKP